MTRPVITVDGVRAPTVDLNRSIATHAFRHRVMTQEPFKCENDHPHQFDGEKVTNSREDERPAEDGETYPVLVCAECGADLHPPTIEKTSYVAGEGCDTLIVGIGIVGKMRVEVAGFPPPYESFNGSYIVSKSERGVSTLIK